MQLVSGQYEYYIDILQNLTRAEAYASTTVIVCLSREDFLRQIAAQNRRQAQTGSEQSSDALTVDGEASLRDEGHALPDLLIPALQLLAISQKIRMVYCPTIPVLRGFLSTYLGQDGGSQVGLSQLIVIDLLALHHGTSEFTLQGLSRSFAAIVSAAGASKAHLRLIECKDVDDAANPDRGSRLWDKQVPLLSGSIKIGLEGSRWAGRALTIKKIASRWFTFEDKVHTQSEQ